MLNISSLSWHYKLRSGFFNSEPTNLCGYFWSVVASILLEGIVHVIQFFSWLFTDGQGHPRRFIPAIVVTAVAVFLIFLAVVMIYAIITNPWNVFLGLLKGIGLLLAVAGALVLFLLLIAGLEEVGKRRRRKPKNHLGVVSVSEERQEPEGESFFMIFWSFLKAKKRKVCPLVTVDGGVNRDGGSNVITIYHDHAS
jgi:hypothetical protein